MQKTIKIVENYIKKMQQENFTLVKTEENLWITGAGSTVAHISVYQENPNMPPIVCFYAIVTVGSTIDQELLYKLLQLNHQIPFGAFSIGENDEILFENQLLGGKHLDYVEFKNAVVNVCEYADDYDDKIRATHGGKRSSDLLRS